MVVLDSESPRCGLGLSVPTAKSLAEIVAEKGRWFTVGQKEEGGVNLLERIVDWRRSVQRRGDGGNGHRRRVKGGMM